MIHRPLANSTALPLLNLIERRFGLRLSIDSTDHLKRVCEHYLAKRQMLLWQYGEAGALSSENYAKAVLISETARLLLREIDPWPRTKFKRTKQ